MKTNRRNFLISASSSVSFTVAEINVGVLANTSNLADDKKSAEDRRVTTQEDKAMVLLENLFYAKQS